MQQSAFFIDETELLLRKKMEEVETKRKTKRLSTKRSSSIKARKYSCEECKLYETCRSPKMQRCGKGKKGILLIGIAPARQEDKEGKPFVGESREELDYKFEPHKIDVHRDCWRTNIIRCRPPNNRTVPTQFEINCCLNKLKKDIEETKPKLIICLGKDPTNTVLKMIGMATQDLRRVHGLVFPSHEFNCWISGTYHPASFLREDRRGAHLLRELAFSFDLKDILSYLDKPLPQIINRETCILLKKSSQCVEFLDKIIDKNEPTAFDYETNCLSPFDKGAKVLTIGVCNNEENAFCIPIGMSEWNILEISYVEKKWIEFLRSRVPKIVQNFNMEGTWSEVYYRQNVNRLSSDTMINHHVLYCRKGTTGLDFQVRLHYGDDYKNMVDTKNLEKEPLEKVAIYNALDSAYTFRLHNYQRPKINDKGKLRDFRNLLTDGIKVLVKLSERGVTIDTKLLKSFQIETERTVETYSTSIMDTKAVRKFEKKFNQNFNINSNDQISKLLFDIYDCPVLKRTGKKSPSVEQDVLDKLLLKNDINIDVRNFLSKLQQYKKSTSFLQKLTNFEKHVKPDGKIHPSFHLNVAESYRSSSSNPNFQNIPIRDELLQLIRLCVVPSKGKKIIEVDYSGMEVRIIAMFSNDRALIKQIKIGEDTHRLWASKVYDIDPIEVTDKQRYYSKNKFVFPSFYGAKPPSIANSFKMDEEWIQKQQNEFWKEYTDVKNWQNSVLEKYKRYGYVEGLTGFRRYGPLKDEQLFNTPVQGTAFHMLLDSLIRIDLDKNMSRMKSVPVLQVHDSITFDAVENEEDELIETVTKIMVLKRYDWQLDVPLEVEWKVGKENWLEMQKIET